MSAKRLRRPPVKATTSISMFDVFNVQSLTRRLLLERTGLWEEILQTAR
jgi:hypothetical protein